MVTIEIVNGPLIPFPSDNTRKEDGAELIFNGRVRFTEHGRKITNLEYEQYEGMAENELNQIAEKAVGKFMIHDLFCNCLLYTSPSPRDLYKSPMTSTA